MSDEFGLPLVARSNLAIQASIAGFPIFSQQTARFKPMSDPQITSPDDAALDDLCGELAELADGLEAAAAWPGKQLERCGRRGVFTWFVPRGLGGQGWTDQDIFRGYLKLSGACLTTTFVITQRAGACRRISGSGNTSAQQALLPDLLSGRTFATVGISHLTTSRRHLARPVLRAEETPEGFLLDGFSPWVTGAPAADVIVVGATLADGREILVAMPTDLPGVHVPEPEKLVGLSASQTGRVDCAQVHVDRRWLLSGPIEGVMAQGKGAATGGLQTSALALGLADAALGFLRDESDARPGLSPAAEAMRTEWRSAVQDLLALSAGEPACSTEALRTRANSLVLRATQAGLSAAKGAGYVVGHPAGRWCREALFFLVWSCPQPVMQAHLCELAGIVD